MADKTDSSTTRITFSTSAQVKLLLEELHERGLYGRTLGDVADRLITEKLREMIMRGEVGRTVEGKGP